MKSGLGCSVFRIEVGLTLGNEGGFGLGSRQGFGFEVLGSDLVRFRVRAPFGNGQC